MWLVQRGLFDYNLKIDLSGLDIAAGSPIIAETVNPNYYGEVTSVTTLPVNKKYAYNLASQTVVLLTIPKVALTKTTVTAIANATVSSGKNASINYGTQKQLSVSLDASQPEKNKVTYIYFDIPKVTPNMQRIVLTVNGKVSGLNHQNGEIKKEPYRLHVYGIPSDKWDQKKLNWNNALLLDSKEALIKEVGQKAFVAGEVAFNNHFENHKLDVTDLIKKHPSKGITFVLVRETRQLGDDDDKGREVMISSGESTKKSTLEFWFSK
jgi:hypothetical protein